jgi:hypothetical protein
LRKPIFGERGSTLLLLMMLTGSMLTIGSLSLNSAVERYKMVSNERLQREALHLAEAGLSQGAAQLKLDDADGFNDSELTSAYPTEQVTINSSSYTLHRWIDTTALDAGKKFKVWLVDNADAGYVSGPSNDTIVSDDDDEDGGVLLVSKGWVEDQDGNVLSSASVKGLYKLVPYPPEYSIIARGDLIFQGNISVTGQPSVHTNGNLTSIGNSDEAEGAVTAAGTVIGSVNLIGGGSTGTGDTQIADMPAFTPDYYKAIASSMVWDSDSDFLMEDTCERVPSTGPDCVEVCYDDDIYTISSPSPGAGALCKTPAGNKEGVYYFDGDVVVNTSGAWAAAVLATGRITLTTNTEITGTSDLPGVALVACEDIVFSGNVSIGSSGNQLGIYACDGYNFSGGGNKVLYGPLIASEASFVNSMSGNISIYYDHFSPPLNSPPIGKLISWTQIE